MTLGIIPDWQFSSDPNVNIAINPYCKIPPEWPNGQRTIQPIGIAPQRLQGDPLACSNGLTPWVIQANPAIPPAQAIAGAQRNVAGARVAVTGGVEGLGITMANWMQPRADLRGIDMFDSWIWRNRKWLVLGGLGLLGLAALGTVGGILR